MTFWNLLCQGSELPGRAEVTLLSEQANKLMFADSKFITFISSVCVFTLLLSRVTNAVINSALHFS